MTVLDVAKQASTVIGVTTPTALFAATDDTSVQIKNCLNETASMIAYDAEHEWTLLKRIASIAGDGATSAFSLPANYQKMLKTSQLWPSWMPNVPLSHVLDLNTWLGLQVQNFGSIITRWTIIGSQINILPVPAAATTIQYPYLCNEIIASSDGSPKTAFDTDTDTFPLGERLLRLGFIYRWKQDRGQDYGEPMEDYNNALSTHIGNDRGSSILVVGAERVRSGAGFAFPGVLGQ